VSPPREQHSPRSSPFPGLHCEVLPCPCALLQPWADLASLLPHETRASQTWTTAFRNRRERTGWPRESPTPTLGATRASSPIFSHSE
jgi:hypothetical protein